MSEDLIVVEVEIKEPRLFLGRPGRKYNVLRGMETGEYYQPKPGHKFSKVECEAAFEKQPTDSIYALMPFESGAILKLSEEKHPKFAQPDHLVAVTQIYGDEDCFLIVSDRLGETLELSLFEAAVELEATEFDDFPSLFD